MIFLSNITEKGQIVIPKKARVALDLVKNDTVSLELDPKRKTVIVRSANDIVDIAGSFKPKKILGALKLREKFEKKYDRI